MTSSGVAAEIKTKLSVVDIVGETVALKRAGSAYKGLCPFHAEKTASFVVSPERETWHCFGCGEGGDIFTFLMKRDGLDFREALTRLADKAGVELSERTAREDRRRRRLREALEAAIAWYREVLLQARQAEAARAYLDERGFSAQTLERFTIGYAPNTWEALSRRLIGRGFSNDELIAAGLASPSNRGGVIDKFRGRVIIPIRDASGRAIGLGGRIMPGNEGPKYLNSPAGPLFDKSRTLFALDLAKAAIRREKLTVIVEGYTDVMAAHQAGFENVVASLGTALTHGQIEQAIKYAEGVALAYDVDLAGEAATQRGLLEELGPMVDKVRVIRIPEGKDPDELVRHDPEAWRRAVAEAQELMDYWISQAAGRVDLNSVSGRRDVAARVLPVIKRVSSPVEQNLYLQQLAKVVRVDEHILADALRREPVRRTTPRTAMAGGPGVGPDPALARVALLPLEADALGLLLRYPALAAEASDGQPLPFRDAAAAALVEAWRERVAAANGDGIGGAELESFVAGLDPASADLARDLLARLAATAEAERLDMEQAREALRVIGLRVRVQRLDEDLRDGRLLLEEAQREGDRSRLENLEQQIIQLGRQKAEATRAMREPAAEAAGTRRS